MVSLRSRSLFAENVLYETCAGVLPDVSSDALSEDDGDNVDSERDSDFESGSAQSIKKTILFV
jgi:hypothetical protein